MPTKNLRSVFGFLVHSSEFARVYRYIGKLTGLLHNIVETDRRSAFYLYNALRSVSAFNGARVLDRLRLLVSS
ncbi:hypothetical protein RvY_10283 [Ramazzottius varieornatus]|uniref:Uncharacterized protein n=1 Tax=Ramazzottius varieornatus TaxID=947166 RepID=A0A1D1VK10_RAMVA|nr:hypothetical protein RvY_10283 [Ramazzottius varieornatus]